MIFTAVKIILYLLGIVCLPEIVFSYELNKYSSFSIYQSMLYEQIPDFSTYNIKNLRIVYNKEIWNENESREFPNENLISDLGKRSRELDMICFNIEHWPIRKGNGIDQESVKKLILVCDAFRKTNLNTKIGFYGILPIRQYWTAISKKESNDFKIWSAQNVALKKLSEKIDIVFPSLYTFYNDENSWVLFAEENIKQAKIYNKPIFAFLWPMYHDSSIFSGSYIDSRYWNLQLETIFKNCDGLVIWGGWDVQNRKRLIWDEKFAWWKTTIQFIKNKGLEVR